MYSNIGDIKAFNNEPIEDAFEIMIIIAKQNAVNKNGIQEINHIADQYREPSNNKNENKNKKNSNDLKDMI